MEDNIFSSSLLEYVFHDLRGMCTVELNMKITNLDLEIAVLKGCDEYTQ